MNTQSSNGCECPTEKGLQWHTYECTFADKPSPEEWEVDPNNIGPENNYRAGRLHNAIQEVYQAGHPLSHDDDFMGARKEVFDAVNELLTADRERVVKERDDLWRGRVRMVLEKEISYQWMRSKEVSDTLQRILYILSTEEITK